MGDMFAFAVPVLTLMLLYCCWRAARLFLRWSPASATVWKHGYGEWEQLYDNSSYPAGDDIRALWFLFLWQRVDDDVDFTDRTGKRHRVQVDRMIVRTSAPDGIYTIWYDPVDPVRHATGIGPGRWLMRAGVCGLALFGVVRLGLALA